MTVLSQIVADGSVTHAEMEQALSQVATCVEQKGVPSPEIEFRRSQGWRFTLGPHETEEEADTADAALSECEARFLSEIGVWYLDEHAPTEAEIE